MYDETMWLRLSRLTSLVVLLGCSGAPKTPAKQADGGYHLACRGSLSDCLHGAERICREQGYSVASARDTRELLGHESGESRIEIRKSEATIYCGSAVPPAERPMVELKREPTTTDAVPSAPPAATTAPTAAPPARACVPGATQACVGPGGCSGGQACAEDGMRFESCNCSQGN
jgi:hypothetical protein